MEFFFVKLRNSGRVVDPYVFFSDPNPDPRIHNLKL
jgi:hypothetical protein